MRTVCKWVKKKAKKIFVPVKIQDQIKVDTKLSGLMSQFIILYTVKNIWQAYLMCIPYANFNKKDNETNFTSKEFQFKNCLFVLVVLSMVSLLKEMPRVRS